MLTFDYRVFCYSRSYRPSGLPSEVHVNEEFSFTVNCGDAESSFVHLVLDFSDGDFYSGACDGSFVLSHTYYSPADYVIIVIATSENGEVFDGSATIHVTNAMPSIQVT